MLDELKNLNYRGGKDGLLFFICDVIGHDGIRIRDAEVICSHAPGRRYLSVEDLIIYCHALSWIKIDGDTLLLVSSVAAHVSDKDNLNEQLIVSSVEQLFSGEVFNPLQFSYDAVQGCYAFKNELLPLPFSTVRNVLVSQGFMIAARDEQGTKFYINPAYDSLIARHCRAKQKKISLEQLRKRLEKNELAGEKAELFVLSFEKERVGQPLCEGIKRISEIDVSAGYDIVSFNSGESQGPDRFIEVKAISREGFYWSKNEYEVAKLKGEEYFLYLVDLSQTNNPDYSPDIIQNPAASIMNSDNWFVEAQSYLIKHI